MARVAGVGLAEGPEQAAMLYERHSGRVFGYCLSRLGAREDAEDATQLTFLHAVRGLRGGLVPAAESAWLLAIARNVCLSRWASVSRRSRVESACDPVELERMTPASELRRDELIGLEQALERLPEQQRRAVLLRDWRGLSYHEVAEQLGISHAAVETLIFRGRAALAEHLEDQPAQQRLRIRSLGELGWLLSSIKNAFTGAAACAKLAAAASAVVAVSGGGIALGTTLMRDTPAAKPGPEQRAAPPRALGAVTLPPVSAGTGGTQVRAVPAARTEPPRTAGPTLFRPEMIPSPTVTTPAAAAPGSASPVSASPVSASAGRPTPAEPVDAVAPVAPAVPVVPVVPTAIPDLEAPTVALPLPDTPLDTPTVEVPTLPAGTLPATDEAAAAIDPVTAAVAETVASAPPLPSPPLPALPGPKEIVPALP